jgi:hypothetical protein
MIRWFRRCGAEKRITAGVSFPDTLIRVPAVYKPEDGVVM